MNLSPCEGRPGYITAEFDDQREVFALSGAYCERIANIALGEEFEDQIPQIPELDLAIGTLQEGERLHMTHEQMFGVAVALRQFAENAPAEVRDYVRQTGIAKFNMVAAPRRLELGGVAISLATQFEEYVDANVISSLQTVLSQEQAEPEMRGQVSETTNPTELS